MQEEYEPLHSFSGWRALLLLSQGPTFVWVFGWLVGWLPLAFGARLSLFKHDCFNTFMVKSLRYIT